MLKYFSLCKTSQILQCHNTGLLWILLFRKDLYVLLLKPRRIFSRVVKKFLKMFYVEYVLLDFLKYLFPWCTLICVCAYVSENW